MSYKNAFLKKNEIGLKENKTIYPTNDRHGTAMLLSGLIATNFNEKQSAVELAIRTK